MNVRTPDEIKVVLAETAERFAENFGEPLPNNVIAEHLTKTLTEAKEWFLKRYLGELRNLEIKTALEALNGTATIDRPVSIGERPENVLAQNSVTRSPPEVEGQPRPKRGRPKKSDLAHSKF